VHPRSHAVLEIIVKRKQRNQYRAQVVRGKLALVDLAGRLDMRALIFLCCQSFYEFVFVNGMTGRNFG
jgi:hypothetical protein